jgi:hypothetical protein
MNLVRVRDVYDREHLVNEYDLKGSRYPVLLKTYHPNGRVKKYHRFGGRATDWEVEHLHRGNICPHDRATWVAARFPDGSPGDYCPICCPPLPEPVTFPPAVDPLASMEE